MRLKIVITLILFTTILSAQQKPSQEWLNQKYSMFIHNPFASEELLGAGNIVRFGMIPFALYFVFHSLWYYLIILIGFFIFGLFAIDWHLFYPYTKNNIMYEQTGNPMYHNLNSEIETLMNEIYY